MGWCYKTMKDIEKIITYNNMIYRVALWTCYSQYKITIYVKCYDVLGNLWKIVYENNILESEYECLKDNDDLYIQIIKNEFNKYIKEIEQNKEANQLKTLLQWDGVIE